MTTSIVGFKYEFVAIEAQWSGAATQPMPRGRLRELLRVNNQRLGDALIDLEQRQQVTRTCDGWTLVALPR